MNRAKAKGTSFETLVARYLVCHFPDAGRHPLHGTVDLGDIRGVPGLVIQCKCHKRDQLSAWLTAAHDQAANAGARYGVVVHKRHGRGQAGDQYVTLTLADFAHIYALALIGEGE
jgi:hypothetical protein